MRAVAAVVALAVSATLVARQDDRAAEGIARQLAQSLGLTEAQVAAVRRGEDVEVDVRPSVDREIAVAGAVRVAVPAARMIEVMRDVERLEQGGGFLATRRISSPATLDDMAALRLPAQDVADLRRCRPGRCEVKLGDGAFSALAAIDWRGPDAEAEVQALARRMAVEYVERYRAGGNQALAIYQDAERPTYVAHELEDMVRRSAVLSGALPEVSAYLLSYPRTRPPGADDFFYWSIAQFGLKPVVRINHVVSHPASRPDGLQGVVTVKQLYASHYFHAALEVRALVDDPERPGAGHYLMVLNLARSDGLTGLMGGIVKKKAREGARKGLQAALRGMKARAEGR
jgi:transcriptional regulator with XRE-family HTH domain